MTGARELCVLLTACAAVAACSGGREDASNAPLVMNLTASPNPAYVNEVVTFTVNCLSAGGENSNLMYSWSLGDPNASASVVTSVPTVQHVYTTATGEPFKYSVTCYDGPITAGTAHATAFPTEPAPNSLKVWPDDLSTVLAGACATGIQGIGWCWQNPLPTGSNLSGVSAVSATVGWAIGNAGTILETTDGGSPWMPEFAAVAVDLVAIRPTDQSSATIVAADGSVLTTDDAGATWKSTTPTGSPFSVTAAAIVSPSQAWAIKSGASIIQTTNGGGTWLPVSVSGVPNVATLNAALPTAISAADSKTIWAVIGGYVVDTLDGNTWDVVTSMPTGIGYPSAVSVTNASNIRCSPGTSAATGSVWLGLSRHGIDDPSLIESTNNGASWQSGQAGVNVNQITAVNPKIAWGFGALVPIATTFITTPVFFDTINANISWSTYTTNSAIGAMDLSDCNHGWAVGSGGQILDTTDAGAHVASQLAGSPDVMTTNLLSITSLSNANAFALGVVSSTTGELVNYTTYTDYQLFSTSDGGLTWVTQIPPTPALTALGNLISGGRLLHDSNGDLLIVGSGILTLVRTPFQSFHTGSDTLDGAAWILSPHRIEPAGATTTSWRNDFSGATIFIPPSATNTCLLGHQSYESWVDASISQRSTWVIDALGDVLEGPSPDPSSYSLVSTACPGIQALWNQSNPQQVIKATNGPVGASAIAAVDASSGVVAVIVGANGLIARSTDIGQTWASINSPTTQNLNAVAIVADPSVAGPSMVGYGWAVGNKGAILRTIDAGATWNAQTWTDTSHPTVVTSSMNFLSVSAVDGQTAWAIGQPSAMCAASCTSVVIYTSDGGTTWTRQPTSAPVLNSVSAVDGKTAWAVGLNGAIIKTVTGGQVPTN